MSTTTRIAKNTLALYFRQILIMLVSLYTVRVLLNTLGAEDYGIYNVVAGVVTMFGFLNGAMAGTDQRFFSIEIGKGESGPLKRVFCLVLIIHIMIAISVLFFAETLGLWFVSNKLIIPIERRSVVLWIYQFSIISFLFTIMTAPFMALILSHEDMHIFAGVSIIDAILKLGLVFILTLNIWDNLKLYSIFMCSIVVINNAIYMTICSIKYSECKFKLSLNKQMFKEIITFNSFTTVAHLALVVREQGISILINQNFSPILVSSRNIAASVNNTVISFFTNFMTGFYPRMIKDSVLGASEQLCSLTIFITKITGFLLLVFSLPIIIEAPIITFLWLKNVPEYLVIFLRLTFIDCFITYLLAPIVSIIEGIGKIKLYFSIQSLLRLLILPISFVLFLRGFPAYSSYIASIIIAAVIFIFRLAVFKSLNILPISDLFRKAIMPILCVMIISLIPALIFTTIFEESIFRLCLTFVVCSLSTSLSTFFICFNKIERQSLIKLCLSGIRRIK